jgi:hypothetical protein
MSERGKPKGGVAIFPRENRSAARNRSGESHHTSTSAARSSRGLSSWVRTISCSFQLLTHTSHPVTKPPRLHFNARKVGMPLFRAHSCSGKSEDAVSGETVGISNFTQTGSTRTPTIRDCCRNWNRPQYCHSLGAGIGRNLDSIRSAYAWFLANLQNVAIEFGKEIDVLVVAEECVHVIRLRQNVATPTVQHGNL